MGFRAARSDIAGQRFNFSQPANIRFPPKAAIGRIAAFDSKRSLALRLIFPLGRNVSAADKPLHICITPENQRIATSSRKMLPIDATSFRDGLTISRFDRHAHEIVAFYPPARDAFSISHIAVAPIKFGFWTISAPEGLCRADACPLSNHPTRMSFRGSLCAS